LKKLNKKRSNRTSFKNDYDDNLCHKTYLDECIDFKSLITNNIEHLSQSSILSNLNSVRDERLKQSLLYIYYDSVNDDEIYNLYNSVSEVATEELHQIPMEKTPTPRENTPSPMPMEKTPSPILKEETATPDVFLFKDSPLTDDKLNNPIQLECLNFWMSLINKIEKERHDKKQAKYREDVTKTPFSMFEKTSLYLEEYKHEITEMLKNNSVCDELKQFSSYYITKTTLDTENNKKLCIVFLLIGYLSRILYYSKTCVLLLKGGKALQFHSPNMPSDDIDILIMPYGDNHEITELPNSKIEKIGKMIVQFILWITSWDNKTLSWNKLFSAKYRALDTSSIPHGPNHELMKKELDSAKIIKLSIVTGTGYFAISDIGMGYNSLPNYIKHIISRFEMRQSDKYLFCYPGKETIIKEKLYYILKYLYECNSPNAFFRDKAFYTLNEFLKNIKDTKKARNKSIEECLKSLDIFIEDKHKNDILNAVTQGVFLSKWMIYNEQTNQYSGPYPASIILCQHPYTMIYNIDKQIMVRLGSYFKQMPVISEKYKLKRKFLE
jgi:hypothetical protein